MRQNVADLTNRAFHVVIDYLIPVIFGATHLTFGHSQPPANRFFRFGSPASQPALQLLHRARTDEDGDGVGIFQLNGAAAGQTVFHYHMHVIPRNHGEDLSIHSREPGNPSELEAMAVRLSKRAYAMRVDE